MKAKIKKFFLLLATVATFALCGVLTACGEPDAVDQTSIKYDGAMITWSEVDKADKYIVTINGKEYTTSTNQFTYVANSADNSFEITVTAVKKDKESESSTKLFSRLAKIEESSISFDENGKMSWTAVAGASEYILEINGKEYSTAALEYTAFEAGKTNTIRIKPVAAGGASFSDWSVQLNKDYLAAPTNIKYDGQIISWTGNNYAKSYQIYINGAKFETPTTGTTFAYDSGHESFDLQLQSIGDGSRSFSSAIGETKRFIFLEEISQFEIKDGTLTWKKVDEASGYVVSINNITYEVETNSFEGIPSGKENKIKVKPVTEEGETYFSDWSQEKTIHILTAPELKIADGLSLDDGQARNIFLWDTVSGDVGGYNIKIVDPDGSARIESLSAEARNFGDAFLTPGEYTISAQTVAEPNSDTYNSAFGKEIKVIRLAAPNQKTQGFITSDSKQVTEGFTVSWQPVSGATEYQLYKVNGDQKDKIAGSVTTKTSMTVSNLINSDEIQAQEFTYGLQAVGSTKTFNTERIITLSSLTTNLLNFKITVLAQPQNVRIEGYTASWSEVPGTSMYATNCADGDTTPTNSYSLEGLSSGSWSFGVCAMGNGSDVLPSNYTPSIKLVRLAAPENIKYSTADGEDGKLTWSNNSASATSYNVWVGDNEAASIDTNNTQEVAKLITTSGTAIHIRAIANYYDNATSTYFLSSRSSATVQLTRLQTIEFQKPVVVGNKLVWNAPSNANSTTTYRVYNKKNLMENGEVTATSFDISELPAGEYVFSVVAVGDGSNWINSERSESASFYKLNTPEVKRTGTAYEWKGVESAVSYAVYVDGELKWTEQHKGTTATHSYVPDFTEKNHTYQVTIYAQGDNGNTTVDSIPYSVKQQTKAASVPTIELGYTGTNYSRDDKVTVTVTEESDYTTGYSAQALSSGNGGGVAFPAFTQVTIDEVDYWQAAHGLGTGKYTVRVYANGGMFDDNGIYYVQSTYAESTITIFEAPSNIEIAEERVSWTPVTDCEKYHVVITYDDGSKQEITIEDGAGFGVSKLTDGKTMADIEKIEICAVGNGSSKISSAYTLKD